MNIRELEQALHDELEADRFADGQHNGLQVEGSRDIARLATAVSVNQDVIDAAARWGADALLTHHGLLWANQPLHVQGVRRKRLKALMDAGLHLLSYHLPLDAHPRLGNNVHLAQAAGCHETEPSFAYKGQTLGIIGTHPDAPRFEAWVKEFEATLRAQGPAGTGPFHVWPFGPERIRRIGFISGAAPYQVQDAIDMRCDAYVTGEVTEGVYHLAKEAGIHFIAGGHYLTERGGVHRLGTWAAQRFGLEQAFFDVETLA